MKHALAIMTALALGGCDNLAPATGGPDPLGAAIIGDRFRAYQPPPIQSGSQSITMPSGRYVTCTTIGSYTNCY